MINPYGKRVYEHLSAQICRLGDHPCSSFVADGPVWEDNASKLPLNMLIDIAIY